MSEYHRHATGDVVQGPAARCVDPNAGARDVLVVEPARLHGLVSDWQANGNSRELGDPTDRVWLECAQQLLAVLDA